MIGQDSTIEDLESFQINFSLLFLSTVLGFLSVNLNYIEKQLPKLSVINQTQRERELIQLKQQLKIEQQQLRIVDDFAKYSKIQRRLNRIDEELKELRNDSSIVHHLFNSSINRLIIQIGINYFIKIIFTLLILICSIYFRQMPVIKLSENINLMPFTSIISYPNGPNKVAFHFWTMCCSTVGRLIKVSR